MSHAQMQPGVSLPHLALHGHVASSDSAGSPNRVLAENSLSLGAVATQMAVPHGTICVEVLFGE
eukprot:6104744-Alexandrium_andersonii.AAC.1